MLENSPSDTALIQGWFGDRQGLNCVDLALMGSVYFWHKKLPLLNDARDCASSGVIVLKIIECEYEE